MNTDRDFTQEILDVRLDCLEHETLSNGAKVLFCYLLDLSLRRSSNDGPGVVTISQTKLSERLKTCRSRVSEWKVQLLQAGLIRCTKKFMPNCWPVDRWHIACLAPDERGLERTTSEGLWGNGARRSGPAGGTGAGNGSEPGKSTEAVEKGPVRHSKQDLPGTAGRTGEVPPAGRLKKD